MVNEMAAASPEYRAPAVFPMYVSAKVLGAGRKSTDNLSGLNSLKKVYLFDIY
jgi:hypothetical protein